MPSTLSVIRLLSTRYPQFIFAPSNEFRWSPSENTVFFIQNSQTPSFLIHELSHALLGHTDYSRDVELIAMERSAWDEAMVLAREYAITIRKDDIETQLDSYRDWLHARSTCPSCSATGMQTKKREYTCLACRHSWRVNEARVCGLKRTTIHTT